MTDEKPQNLTAKQRKCIAALLSAPTVTQAAELVGCSRETVYVWLRLPVFQAELRARQTEALSTVTAGLVHLLGRSLTVLSADLDGGGMRASRAALGILYRFAGLAAFLDLAGRVAELERQAQNGTGNTSAAVGKDSASSDGCA